MVQLQKQPSRNRMWSATYDMYHHKCTVTLGQVHSLGHLFITPQPAYYKATGSTHQVKADPNRKSESAAWAWKLNHDISICMLQLLLYKAVGLELDDLWGPSQSSTFYDSMICRYYPQKLCFLVVLGEVGRCGFTSQNRGKKTGVWKISNLYLTLNTKVESIIFLITELSRSGCWGYCRG